MKHILSCLLLVLSATMAIAQSPKTPSVEIANFTQPSPTSIEYDVVVHADCVQYLYVHADSSIFQMAQALSMTLEQVLDYYCSMGLEWIDAAPGQTDHYAFSDFEPNTDMLAIIYAKNASGESSLVFHPFTTGQGGGTGTAQLTMAVTFPQSGKAKVDITINDQTAYYWYYTVDEEMLSSMGLSVATATTQDYYQLMNQMVNTYGMTYMVHSSDLSETLDAQVGTNYVSVAFPFNANDELGNYTEPILFTGHDSQSVTSTDNSTLSCWPNPTPDQLTIKCGNTLQKLTLYDLQGRIVLQRHMEGNITLLDLSPLPQGHYLLQAVTTQGRTLIRNIIKK